MLSPAVCYEASACLVSDPSSLIVPLSVAAVQRAYVARRTQPSDAVIPNKTTTRLSSNSAARVDTVNYTETASTKMGDHLGDG